jgi:hypothetical protein
MVFDVVVTGVFSHAWLDAARLNGNGIPQWKDFPLY